jgi:VWFA-related protein
VPPGTRCDAQAAQPKADAQTAVFRAGIDLVLVEATAVDRAGNAFRGLRPSDFRAEIGGRPREVLSVEFVEYDDQSARGTGMDPGVTTNLEESSSRAVLVVVDQSSLRPEGRGVLEGAKRWLATLSPADRLGFLGLPAPGPFVDFTTDHAKVLAAFDELKAGVGGAPLPYVGRNVSLWEAFQIEERNDAVRAEVIARECRQRDPACPAEVTDNARAIVADSQDRVRPVLSALRDVLRRLGAVPGPKHVVLVSSGWPIEERNAAAEVSALAADAARSNATVHTFTAEEWAMSASAVRLSPRRTFDQNLLLSSVEIMAGYTGGRSVRLAGTGEGAFKSLTGGLSGYYRLAVRPAPEDLDGQARRIGLEVARSGVSLAGYRRVMAGARPAPAPEAIDCAAAIREALRSQTPRTVLGLRATSYVLHGDDPGGLVRVAVAGDVVRAAEGPATMVAVLFSPNGKPGPGTEQTLQIPAAGAARVLTTLGADPGEYVLRLVACDRHGRVGSLERFVDATWHLAGGVVTTDLVLFRARGPADPPEPVLDVVSTEDRLIAQLPLLEPLTGTGKHVVFALTPDGAPGPTARLAGRLGQSTSGATVAESVLPVSALAPGRYTITASVEPDGVPVAVRTIRVEAP